MCVKYVHKKLHKMLYIELMFLVCSIILMTHIHGFQSVKMLQQGIKCLQLKYKQEMHTFIIAIIIATQCHNNKKLIHLLCYMDSYKFLKRLART